MRRGGNVGKPEVAVSFAHPWRNIVRSSNIWEVATGSTGSFTQDRRTEFITNADDGVILGKTLYAGMEVLPAAENELLGDWVVRWTGDAEVAFNPTGGSTPPGSGWIAQGGQLTFSVTDGNGVGSLFARNNSGSQIADFVSSLECVKYSDFSGATVQDQIDAAWASYDAGNIVSPEMVAVHTGSECIRTLNFWNAMANNAIEPTHLTPMSCLSWASFRDGLNSGSVPLEAQIQFAREVGAQTLWIHVPTLANEQLIISIAQTLESLAQGIYMILQIGNEIWNFGGEFSNHTKIFGLRNLGGATVAPIQTAAQFGTGYIQTAHGLQNGQYIVPIQNEFSLQQGEDNASLLHGVYYDPVNDNFTRYKRVVNATANTFELETYGNGTTGTLVTYQAWETSLDYLAFPVGNDPEVGAVQDFGTSYGSRLAYIYDLMRINAPTKWAAGEFIKHIDSQFTNNGLGVSRINGWDAWVAANSPTLGQVQKVSIAPYGRSDESLFFANLTQTAGGSGYSVGERLNLTGGTTGQTDLQITVTSVDGGGAVTGWDYYYYGADEYYYGAPTGEAVSHAGGFAGNVTWGWPAPTTHADLLAQSQAHVDYRVVPEIEAQYQAHVAAGQDYIQFDLYEFGWHDTDLSLASLVSSFQTAPEMGTATTYYLTALDNTGRIDLACWYTMVTKWADGNLWGLLNSTGQALTTPKFAAFANYPWEGATDVEIIGHYTAIENGRTVIRERSTDYENMQQITVSASGIEVVDHPLNLSFESGTNLTFEDGKNLQR